ncbi:protein FAR1-RELATED SEQUENCE 5-like [Miscanthus floridulus]|uniref:protein FAR1-RELATED SEQUENCE 5-like n=1 Tax=Miscanthus floridulus TaxID=154761 RepID=UPI003458DB04
MRKSYCEWGNGHNERTLRKFVYRCEGFREENELKREIKKRKSWNITRVGCPAKFVIAQDQNIEYWYMKDFIYEHNHPMAERDLACLLRSHRRISSEQKADIVAMQISRIRKHQIMDIMEIQYGGYDKVEFIIRDLYNFCHRNKVGTVVAGDAQIVISYLTECRHRDSNFFFD